MHQRRLIAGGALAALLSWPWALPRPRTSQETRGHGGRLRRRRSADIAARIIAKKLGENIGQSVVVENKPGAGGNLAHTQVANGPSDGSVLLFGSIGPLAIAPHFMKIGYDPLKDLAPITMGVNFPNVLVVPAATGIKTLGEYVAKARREPGKLDFASTGPGSASHLAGELLNDVAKIDTLHVPYKGGAPALQDVLGNRVTSFYAAPPTALPTSNPAS